MLATAASAQSADAVRSELAPGASEQAQTAPEQTQAGTEEQFKTMSGMSVLGNNEAPKSLVIVPWKSSQIGDGIGVVDSLSNRPMPVDRDVFTRELKYYRIRADDRGVSTRSEDVELGSR
jgi:hypothetical protein